MQSIRLLRSNWLRRALTNPHAAYASSFQSARRGEFFQEPFQLTNPFQSDTLLRTYLKRTLPDELHNPVTKDLNRFGDRVVAEIDGLGRECEQNPPKLKTYDAWGNRTDELITCQAWKKMHDISAEEGLVSVAYDRGSFVEFARLYSCVKLFLFAPSSGLYSCPLAMTDGAAKLIETVPGALDQLKDTQGHLLSRSPTAFWTSGQWMTERGGGSDVASGTDTVAVDKEGVYHLFGYKWFSSATDADVTFTLAREVSQSGEVTPGTKGLSLFFVKVRNADGSLNNMEIHKLKDKLGTRQLPTAELLLTGAKAQLVGERGRGVAGISPMLTITRLHNSISAVSVMRRILQLSKNYSAKRKVFGRLLSDHALHTQTLSRLEVQSRGCLLLMLETTRLLGRVECGKANEEESHLLRVLTPLVKLYTGKLAVPFVSEVLESFGGQGYIEETGLPVLLRDAQVLPIWEGTTNVLSLDVLRSMQKSQNVSVQVFLADIQHRLQQIKTAELQDAVQRTLRKLKELVESSSALVAGGVEQMVLAARDFSLSLAQLYAGMLLLEHADCSVGSQADVVAAERWSHLPLALLPLRSYSSDTVAQDRELLSFC